VSRIDMAIAMWKRMHVKSVSRVTSCHVCALCRPRRAHTERRPRDARTPDMGLSAGPFVKTERRLGPSVKTRPRQSGRQNGGPPRAPTIPPWPSSSV
jgi:hypothetical protein